MELDSEDEFMLLSVLILKRRIRRKSLTKKKERRTIWVKEIFKEREILSYKQGYFLTVSAKIPLLVDLTFLFYPCRTEKIRRTLVTCA